MLSPQQEPRLHHLNWWLWAVQLALCGLLSSAFSPISLGCFLFLLIGKLMQLSRHWRSWRLTESNGVAAVLILLFMVTNQGAGVLAMMVHLLYLAALLRLLGFRTTDQSDVKQLLLVHYVLFACVFILQQDLISTLVVLVVLLMQFCAHYLAFASQPLRLNLSAIGKTTAVLIPLWALLFLFLPRLPPLWQLPSPHLATTGLADRISVGSITQLVGSDELVFRAEFTSAPPAMADLYWRARVYLQFDGEQWHQPSRSPRMDLSKVVAAAATTPQQTVIEYKLLIEPHQQRHLFTLGQPLLAPEGSRMTNASLLMLQRPLLQQSQLTLQSLLLPVLQDGPLTGDELQLPPGNPQSRALAQRLQQQLAAADATQRPSQLVQLIQQYLQQQGFVYSLTPPELTDQQIDQFMFDSKTGFCSHYAQAAVFLLRAAGVPSRIVGGYLGGSWQAGGRYLQVRQKEAHAWVEYYQQGQWHRFDPTLAVAPDRAFLTLDELFATEPLGGPMVKFLQNHWQRWMLQPLADLDYFWSRWILGFDQAQQWQLWQRVQQHAVRVVAQLQSRSQAIAAALEPQTLTLWWQTQQRWLLMFGLALPFVTILLMVSWRRWRMRQQLLQDPAAFLLQLLPASAKQPSQSIQALLLQLAQQHSDLAPQLQRLSQLYQQVNFSGRSNKRTQQELLQLGQQLQRKLGVGSE
jgi:transglutaminase-like putative cysteine protease